MPTEKQITYKGFDENFQCRGFQYEVGKTYIHSGDVKACESGFHSCTNPLDVWAYYDVTQRFAIAEIGGSMSQQDNSDSKIASAEITIKAELSLPMFITAAIEWMQNYCKDSNLAASGTASKLAASGDNSNLAASGDGSNLAASGYRSNLAASGHGSNLAASGYGSNLAASGSYSYLAASGYGSKLAASGNGSKLAASGYRSKLAASGYRSKLAASGDDSKLAASGYGSNLAASGYGSKLAASGNGSKLAASGNGSKLAASGSYSVVMSAGLGGRIKVGVRGAAAVAYEDVNGRIRIAVGYEGENIEAGIWYVVDQDGAFIPEQK